MAARPPGASNAGEPVLRASGSRCPRRSSDRHHLSGKRDRGPDLADACNVATSALGEVRRWYAAQVAAVQEAQLDHRLLIVAHRALGRGAAGLASIRTAAP